MDLSGLVDFVGNEPVLAEAIADCRSGRLPTLDITLTEPARPLMVAALAGQAGRPLLLVTSTFREAEAATAALTSLLGPDEVAYYPAWETLPHERLSPRSDTVGRRLAVLRRLAGNDPLPMPRVVVAPVRSVLQPQVTGLGDLMPVQLVAGEDYDIADVAQGLVDAAYVRVDLVERRGEFCVRGGIIDLFPPTLEHPVRIDFFGDTVEEIRPFAVADQRSFDQTLDRVVASPCRELLLTDAVRERAAVLARVHLNTPGNLGRDVRPDRLRPRRRRHGGPRPRPRRRAGAAGRRAAGQHPGAAQRPRTHPRPRPRAGDHQRGVPEGLVGSCRRGRQGADRPGRFRLPQHRRRPRARPRARPGLVELLSVQLRRGRTRCSAEPDEAGVPSSRSGEHATRPRTSAPCPAGSSRRRRRPVWRGDTEAAVATIRASVAEGKRTVLVADSSGLAARMEEILKGADIPVSRPDSLTGRPADRPGHRCPCRAAARVQPARPRPRRLHRRRPLRAAGRGQGLAQDAGPAQEPDRPARAEPR